MLDRLDRITKRAESHPEEAFNNLFSLLNDELLWDAFRKLKRDKAPGGPLSAGSSRKADHGRSCPHAQFMATLSSNSTDAQVLAAYDDYAS